MDNIKITLETLYDMLRNEKKKEDLQKLDNSFFIDVVSYLREKKALLDLKNNSDELFAASEKDKVEYEMRSIKRILKELYEKREKKILDIAMNRSRTGSDIIDTSSMLREEKIFYDRLLKTLDFYRGGVLLNLFQGELPDINEGELKRTNIIREEKKPSSIPEQVKTDTFSKFEGAPIMSAEDEDTSSFSEKKVQPEKKKLLEELPKTSIRFIHPMPSFVWKDLKVYGPFDKGDKVDIFPEVADLLIRKGRAEKV
ncbi:MAG: hypothetical protein KKA62_03785 [Nanoarchaeota archaeon]|nr:hypothetical protein [Nanoarchaeota archaeon]MBU1644152.1 hypothetical protein [Nanoarchaeota archaeon]MBU1977046.1 hypothetical protein [Nanoarchaeota archaeon]